MAEDQTGRAQHHSPMCLVPLYPSQLCSPPKCPFSSGWLRKPPKGNERQQLSVLPPSPLLSSVPTSLNHSCFIRGSWKKQCPNPRGTNNPLMEKHPASYQKCFFGWRSQKRYLLTPVFICSDNTGKDQAALIYSLSKSQSSLARLLAPQWGVF